MKYLIWSLIIVAVCALASCRPSSNAERDAEGRAEYHMRVADSLESASALQEAALEYKLVAELYPKSSYYASAVRNTALLYSNPANPAVDDSLSLQWFQTYMTLPIGREERVKAEIYVTMLKRITSLRNELNRRLGASDSLQMVTKRMAADLQAKSKRLQDVEADLKQTTVELQRLRDIDVRINRRKGTK
jgi:hypothetical protein